MADNPPTGIQALVIFRVNAFSTPRTSSFFLGVFGDAIIIDGIAHIAGWIKIPSQLACRRGKVAPDLSVPRASVASVGFWNVEGLYLRRRLDDAGGDDPRPDRRWNRHARLYVFKARRGMEDRRSSWGARRRAPQPQRPVAFEGRRLGYGQNDERRVRGLPTRSAIPKPGAPTFSISIGPRTRWCGRRTKTANSTSPWSGDQAPALWPREETPIRPLANCFEQKPASRLLSQPPPQAPGSSVCPEMLRPGSTETVKEKLPLRSGVDSQAEPP